MGYANKSFSHILHGTPKPSFEYHKGYLLQFNSRDTLWGAIKFGAFKNLNEALRLKRSNAEELK